MLALRGLEELIRGARRWKTYKMPSPKMAMTVIFVCLVIFTSQSIGIGSSAYIRQQPTPRIPITGQTHIKPITQDSHDAQCICSGNNLIRRHTLAVIERVVPLPRDGLALEEIPEEEHDTPDSHDHEASPEDVAVNLLDGEAEEEDADAELDEHHVDDVRCCCEGLPLEALPPLASWFKDVSRGVGARSVRDIP